MAPFVHATAHCPDTIVRPAGHVLQAGALVAPFAQTLLLQAGGFVAPLVQELRQTLADFATQLKEYAPGAPFTEGIRPWL